MIERELGKAMSETERELAGQMEGMEYNRDQLYEIGLPRKSILGDYFQENRTSRDDSFG